MPFARRTITTETTDQRCQQKEFLLDVLKEIQYGGLSLDTQDGYVNSPNRFPYSYVLSGNGRVEWMSNRTYRVKRTYYINVVFKVGEDKKIPTKAIDDVEGLMISKLLSIKTRAGNKPACDDLQLIDWTTPFQDDVALRDSTILKTFVVECETYEEVHSG